MSREPSLSPPYPLAPEAVAREALSLSPGGVPLGTVAPGSPVTLTMARPVGTTIAMLADMAAVTLLCHRAALAGTRVLACAPTPEWGELAARAGAERNPAQWIPPEVATTVVGDFDRPVLLVLPASGWPDVAPFVARPWTSAIVVLPRVDLASMTIARTADIVILGAVPRPHLTLVRSTLRLPGEAVSGLTEHAWSQLLVVARGRYAPVDLHPSPDERRRCGPPAERAAAERPTPPFWGERSFEEVAGLRAAPPVQLSPPVSQQGVKQ